MSRIRDFVTERFPQRLVRHYNDLLSKYADSGLAPPNLVGEITSGDEGKLLAHVWEALYIAIFWLVDLYSGPAS